MKKPPLLLRMALVLPVIGLFLLACWQPALFLDSGGQRHGDNLGPGRGTLTGWVCLLFGWMPGDLTLSWWANPCLWAALLLFVLDRPRAASACAVVGSLLGLATPLLLLGQREHPLAYPLMGYYLWQSSLMWMQALCAAWGPRPRSLRLGEAVLLGVCVAVLSLQPSVFRERAAQTRFHITGQLILPGGEDPQEVEFALTIPEAHLDVYPPPVRFTRWNPDMNISADGRFEVNARLPVLGRPSVVETSVKHPGLLPFRASHPLTRTGNLYEAKLPQARPSPLELRAMKGPALFQHPNMDYRIQIPAGWELLPEGRGPNVSLRGPEQRAVSLSLHPGADIESQAVPGSYRATNPEPKAHPRGISQTQFSFRYQSKDSQFVTGVALSRSSSSLVLQARASGSSLEQAEARFKAVQAVLDSFQ